MRGSTVGEVGQVVSASFEVARSYGKGQVTNQGRMVGI
ncbi:hypothetical protein NSU_1989 [Novosphingobium pentaromativorans US6-1]|uniref:Uncharacterized protein n=1 Tax=Novosphingobium pentaromativorans US6-1 TaxID=1088721 RepID=G6ECB8_9SPHN|nr:hypothetical protein NSU_1989 [Novosphingobium pentaromativorans US6-1]